MIDNLGLGQEVIGNAERGRGAGSDLNLQGHFSIEHWRDGKLVKTIRAPNGITNEGKDDLLDGYLRNQTIPTTFYIGVIDLAGYSALAAGDTMSSHAGWAEATAYTEATRPAWGPSAAASQSITNATPVTFSINGTVTIKGVFIVSNSTKSGTTGILWSTALFSGDQAFTSGDVLKVTYTANA